MDVLNGNEMQWASRCGVSFGDAMPVYAKFMTPLIEQKMFPAQ